MGPSQDQRGAVPGGAVGDVSEGCTVPPLGDTGKVAAIRTLLFDYNEAPVALALLKAFLENNPTPFSKASILTYLLNHHTAQVRAVAGRELAGLQGELPHSDLLPILFSAWKREPNEGVRQQLGDSMRAYPVGRVSRLQNYFEGLSFSVYAKAADMGIRSQARDVGPEMLERALIILHLDHSSEARQVASAALCTRFRRLDPAQRSALSLSLVYALSDPRISNEYIVSNLLYIAEQMSQERMEGVIPLIRRLYDSENPLVKADAALVGLCLGEDQQGLLDVTLAAIENPLALCSRVDVPDNELLTTPIIDFEQECRAIGQWVEAISGRVVNSSEVYELLGEFQDSYHAGCQEVVDTFNARISLLYQRLEGFSVKHDKLCRELFILRAAGQIDRLPAESRLPVLEALLRVMDDPREDLGIRKAVISGVVYGSEYKEFIAMRVRSLIEDMTQPDELRRFACTSLSRLLLIGPTCHGASTDVSPIVGA